MKTHRPIAKAQPVALTQKGAAAKEMRATNRDKSAPAKGAVGRRDARPDTFVLRPVTRQRTISQSQADKAVREYLSKR